MNGLTWILERFESNLNKSFMIFGDEPYSYSWLLEQISDWTVRLDKSEVCPGTTVAIEGDFSPHSVAAIFALIKRNAIVIPYIPGVKARRKKIEEIAEAQIVISFSKKTEGTINNRITEVQNSLTRKLIEKGDPGLVLFSSASSGKSRAALHNFIPFLERYKQRRHSWLTLNFLLFDHIGGLNTLFYTLSNTGTVVCLNDRHPDHVCRTIEKYRIELLPTSPTFLNLLLLSEAYKRYDLSSLQRITYGTEVMPSSTLQRIHKCFPHVEFQQTYGLTELGIQSSKSRSSESTWVKIGGDGIETKIQNGILSIRAKSSMLGYLNAPSPFDEDGWFNTGDSVEVDGEYMRLLGRHSEIINVGGEKVYPTEVENVLLEITNVRDAVVHGYSNAITGQVVAARLNLVEPEEIRGLRRRIQQFCRNRLAPYKIPVKIEIITEPLHSQRFKKLRKLPSK